MTLKPLLLGAALCALTTPALAETFVLVHGAFQTASDWTQVAADLTAGRADGGDRRPAGPQRRRRAAGQGHHGRPCRHGERSGHGSRRRG